MKSYDGAGNVNCDLSVLGTKNCQIDFEISLKSLNGTVATLATGSVIIQSECYQLETVYKDPSTSNSDFWAWDIAKKSIFDAGYELRTP